MSTPHALLDGCLTLPAYAGTRYGVVKHNYYMVAANGMAVVIGVESCMVTYAAAPPSLRRQMEVLMAGLCKMMVVTCTVAGIVFIHDFTTLERIVGSVNLAVQLVFFASPAAATWHVIKSQSRGGLTW